MLPHNQDLIDDKFFLWLLREIHGFYGNFPTRRNFYSYVDCTRCSTNAYVNLIVHTSQTSIQLSLSYNFRNTCIIITVIFIEKLELSLTVIRTVTQCLPRLWPYLNVCQDYDHIWMFAKTMTISEWLPRLWPYLNVCQYYEHNNFCSFQQSG